MPILAYLTWPHMSMRKGRRGMLRSVAAAMLMAKVIGSFPDNRVTLRCILAAPSKLRFISM